MAALQSPSELEQLVVPGRRACRCAALLKHEAADIALQPVETAGLAQAVRPALVALAGEVYTPD